MCSFLSVLVVAAEDPLGDGHGGHGLGPAGVESEMGDGFDELFFAVAVLLGEVEVEHELVGVAYRGERDDGREAALLRRQLGALPDVSEQDVVGVTDESGCEVPNRRSAADGWCSSVVSDIGSSFLSGGGAAVAAATPSCRVRRPS